MKVYEEFIRSHLPEELANRPLDMFDYYFMDGLNVMTEGERGAPDEIIYKAKSEEDLMLWQFGRACELIGSWPSFEKRMGYPKTWRYYRHHAEKNRWLYTEYKKYDYNAIEDSRLEGFEKYLALTKLGFPKDRWENEVKHYVHLMNYWYLKPHWDYDKEKLCFIEISDSKEHDEHSNPIDEPRPGSIIQVDEGYYSFGKNYELEEDIYETEFQDSCELKGKPREIIADILVKSGAEGNKNWILKELNLEMIYCPAGSFRMGSSRKKEEYPPHQVIITKPFYIGKFPITQKQYLSVTGNNPSYYKDENNPVEEVSWDDAKEFCEKINEKYKDELPIGYKFSLPTEAQWEYACRAGTTKELNNDTNLMSGKGISENLNEVAFYAGNSNHRTHPVGQKKPNSWGIYDMHGNVHEWCEDVYEYYPNHDVTDPKGPESGSYHLLRGGSYLSEPISCRSAARYYNYHDDKQKFMGFRLALVKE